MLCVSRLHAPLFHPDPSLSGFLPRLPAWLNIERRGRRVSALTFFFLKKNLAVASVFFFSHFFGVVFSREAEVWALHKRHLWGAARRKSGDCVRHLVRRSVWLDAWMQPGQQQRVETLAVCEASLPSQIMTPLWSNSGADLDPPGFFFSLKTSVK